MKVSLKRKIDYVEVDSKFIITLHSLVRILQEATIKHFQKVGVPKPQVNDGSVWILYQFGIEVLQWALYEENIEIVTWHRGTKGYKVYREFEVYSGKEKIATASAVYLYYDLKNQKITKIPEDINTIYSVEDEVVFKEDLALWKPVPRVNQEFQVSITTRLSDFDPMEHVNNSVYFDYIETMLFSYWNMEKKISKIKIQYTKEINKSVKILKAGISEDGAGYQFKLFDREKIFAFGEIEIKEIDLSKVRPISSII